MFQTKAHEVGLKVPILKSLGAKLFYLMVALVLITVAGSALQFSITFKRHITTQVQDTILMQAEKASSQIGNVVDNWRSQAAVAVPTLRALEAKDLPEQMENFINANSEYVGLQLLEAPTATSTAFTDLGSAFTANVNDQRFEDKIPTRVWAKIQASSKKWLTKNLDRFKKDKFSVASLSSESRLPIMITVIRFEVTASKKVLWAILTTWQSELIKALPKSQYVDSYVIDDQGRIITSTSFADMISNRSTKTFALSRSALAATAPSGLENEYLGTDQKRKLGAFSRLQKLDLKVLVERDSDQAYKALWENLVSTALWAMLFILIAVMFSFIGAAGITKSLREVAFATTKIASGDFNFRIQPKAQDEVGLLGLAVNLMSRRILILLQAQVERARLEKELETAKMVQSTFFPKKDIKTAAMDVTGFYQPASECGGDLWGHFTISEGIEFIFIADAMGHGAPAALVTAMAFSTCMTVADIFKDQKEFADSPSKVLERMNRIIYDAVEGTISMTCFAAILDTNRGTMTFANAGHNFPVLIANKADDPRGGKPSKNKKKSLEYTPISLKLRGIPLGMSASTIFTQDQIALEAGDKIFFFTDGLIECTSPEGNVWGRKMLLDQIIETASMSAEGMKSELVTRAFKFFGSKAIEDDVTIVVAEIDKAWKPKEGMAPPPFMTSKPFAEPVFANPADDFKMGPVTAGAPEPARLTVFEPSSSNEAGSQSEAPSLSPGEDISTFEISMLVSEPKEGQAADVAAPPIATPTPWAVPGKFKIKLPSTG